MEQVPASVRPNLHRLARRLALGLFLDIWPRWAMAALLASGTVVLICRMFVPAAARWLPWVWIAPLVAMVPAAVLCVRRTYRPMDVAALADTLGGGRGFLLSLLETKDQTWGASRLMAEASSFALPRIRWRQPMMVIGASLAFLIAAWMVPQRAASVRQNPALARQMAADLQNAVVQLKEQALITPEEEQRLEEDIKRLEQSASERVDAASWEAADALREQMTASMAEKQDAVKWAQESLARFAAAAEAGGGAGPMTEASAAELQKALDRLAQNGLSGAIPPDLLKALQSGKLPSDPAALRNLTQALATQLAQMNGKFSDIAALGAEPGRFDPKEFAISNASTDVEDGLPGAGAATRGRGDADLTMGAPSPLLDKFKSHPLPPGAMRSPDDWTPVVTLPGAPNESAVLSRDADARQYAETAGQAAWRRTLAPRHLTAVKKYFGKGR